jgi:uncharacterized protein YjiK
MSRRRKFGILLALLLLGAPTLAVSWYYRLVPLAWHWSGIAFPADTRKPQGLRLADYRVTLEARPVAGIARNISGLTYNPRTRTLFAAINKPAQVAEISAEGQLLRLIPVAGIDDLEGISHVRDNLFLLIDERKQRIYRNVPINPGTQGIDPAPWLELGFLLNGNLGFEGITWNEQSQWLFVAKEKPPRIFEIKQSARDGDTPGLHIRDGQAPVSFMRDLSALSIHEQNGHLLALSDESRLLAEYSKAGELIGLMPLWRGWHGLERSIPQAEGVAVAPGGTIYIVSEPNLFYRFERETPAQATDTPS